MKDSTAVMFTSNTQVLKSAVQEWLSPTLTPFAEIQTDNKWVMISLSDSSSLTGSKYSSQKQVMCYLVYLSIAEDASIKILRTSTGNEIVTLSIVKRQQHYENVRKFIITVDSLWFVTKW